MYKSGNNRLFNETKKLYEKIIFKKIVDNFIVSLSNRRLDSRSAIACYKNFELNDNNDRILYKYGQWTKEEISNQDINVLNF